ncbi:MAG: 4-hydroxy-tetrahydrodipicolinate reductase [Natronospirillum sp.]
MNIAITGAPGRMGRTLVQMIHAADDLRLAGATDRPGSELLGLDIGVLCGLGETGVPLVDDLNKLPDDIDAVIDFTTPASTMRHLTVCAQRGFALVIGTTGLDETQKNAIGQAADRIPVVFAPNMSVGVNVLTNLVEQAARILGDAYDVEIVEMHHRHKVDAPSGTALALGEAAAKGLQRTLQDCAIYGREGAEGPRESSTIGFATLRGGDVVGDHTVIYAGEGERVEITHKASSRSTFAQGALRAVRWLHNRPAGQYSMQDVLGL